MRITNIIWNYNPSQNHDKVYCAVDHNGGTYTLWGKRGRKLNCRKADSSIEASETIGRKVREGYRDITLSSDPFDRQVFASTERLVMEHLGISAAAPKPVVAASVVVKPRKLGKAKFAKCVDNSHYEDKLTLGVRYKIKGEEVNLLTVVDDTGSELRVLKARFAVFYKKPETAEVKA